MNKSQATYNKIINLIEEYSFPTQMKIRPMTQSEAQLYNATYFPSGIPPCIGSFLNVSWIAILDYNGLTIRPIDDPNHMFRLALRARIPEELCDSISVILNTLVTMSSEAQLYDNDYLGQHNFVPVSTMDNENV